MVQFLSSLINLKRRIALIIRLGIPISLEIATFDQTTHFYIVIPEKYQTLIEAQLAAQYPKALIVRIKDYSEEIFKSPGKLYQGRIKVRHGSLFPIKTYKDFKDVDPLSSILGLLAKLDPNDKAVIQYLLVPVGTGWQDKGQAGDYRR